MTPALKDIKLTPT